MCIVCRDWQAGKLTSKEALGALGELINSSKKEDKEHYFEVSEKILDKEVPVTEDDSELDKSWYEETHDGD